MSKTNEILKSPSEGPENIQNEVKGRRKGSPILRNSITDSVIPKFGSEGSIKPEHPDSSSENRSTLETSSESIQKDGSLVSVDERSRKVHFRDEIENPMVIEPGTVESVSQGLVDVAYFDTLMKASHPWEDPNYYAGFTDLFSTDEIWISDITLFPCRINSTFEIENKEGKTLFYVDKVQDTWMTWVKSMCLRPFSRARAGFIITVLSLQQSILAKYVRKQHCYADQMDIVETFYAKEQSYIGRIEKTRHGFLIRDKENEDIYRLIKFNAPTHNSRARLLNMKQEFRIFRTDSKEVVGRVMYAQRSCLWNSLSPCTRVPKFGILCNPDVGTNAKILIIGALFFQLHSKESFIDLPLGNDSELWGLDMVPFKDSATSLDLLLRPFNYSSES